MWSCRWRRQPGSQGAARHHEHANHRPNELQPSHGWCSQRTDRARTDALGGYSGIVTDHTAVQFRMLNRSKGPAMESAGAKRPHGFAAKWRSMLEAHPNIDFWQEMIRGLIVRRRTGARCSNRNGTRNWVGYRGAYERTFWMALSTSEKKQFRWRKSGRKRCQRHYEQLNGVGFEAVAWKRVRLRLMAAVWITQNGEQPGDEPPGKFSYTDTPVLKDQLCCWTTSYQPGRTRCLADRLLISRPCSTAVFRV